MANSEFLGLVHSLQATAEAALGDLNAASASAQRDGLLSPQRARHTAERSLRLLSMLAEKTRGNLDLTESQVLGDAVASLRGRLSDIDTGDTDTSNTDITEPAEAQNQVN